MSQFRHRFRVTVDGVPHDLVTSARDYADAEVEAEDTAGMKTYRLIHVALMRLGVAGVPSDFDTFVDILDDFDDLDGVPVGVPGEDPATPDEEAAGLGDPTQSAA